MIDPPPRTSPGWRRVAAFAVDYGVILAYLGLLALVGVLGRAVGVLPTEVTTPAARVVAQLAGIAVLTLPVTLWFAGWEAGPGGATPGKQVLGLRVVTTGGERLGWPRSLPRTALKFILPWELAHTAVWNMLAWPGDGGPVVDMVLLGVANAVIVVDLVSLFVGTRRTPTITSRAPLSRPPDDAAGVAAHPSTAAAGGPSVAAGILEGGVGNQRPGRDALKPVGLSRR